MIMDIYDIIIIFVCIYVVGSLENQLFYKKIDLLVLY